MAVTVDYEEGLKEERFGSEDGQERRKPRQWKRALAGFVALAAVAVAGEYWSLTQRYETTDDAQVDGHIANVSTRVSGTVLRINPDVENDRYVKAGTLLLELDPRDYDQALAHARATLRAKEAESRTAQLQVPITRATAFGQLRLAEAGTHEAEEAVATAEAELGAAKHRVQQDEAIAARAERDRVSYRLLVDKREIARSFYDARETEASATAQTVEADQAAVAAAEQKVAQARSTVQQREAQIAIAQTAPQQLLNARAQWASSEGELEQARVDLGTAELNARYTRVNAPVSGVIGHKTVELGHSVQPGQSLLTIVPVDD